MSAPTQQMPLGQNLTIFATFKAEFANLREAQAWADAEPFLAAGVYARISVKPFRKALPV